MEHQCDVLHGMNDDDDTRIGFASRSLVRVLCPDQTVEGVSVFSALLATVAVSFVSFPLVRVAAAALGAITDTTATPPCIN